MSPSTRARASKARVVELPVTTTGIARVDLPAVLPGARALLSLQVANNETGVVQSVAEAAATAKAQGIAVTWVAITAAIPDATMPVGLVIAIGILGLAQTQLNLLAGTNVVTEPVVPAREVVVRLADAARTVAGPASPLADGTQVRVTRDQD